MAVKHRSCDVDLGAVCKPPECSDLKAPASACPDVKAETFCPLAPGVNNCQVCLFGVCGDEPVCAQNKREREAAQNLCLATTRPQLAAAKQICQVHADAAIQSTCVTNRPAVVRGCIDTRTAAKTTCEIEKIAEYQTCIKTNYLNNEPMGPATTNMYRRALGHPPSIPDISERSSIVLPPLPAEAGELELATDSKVIVAKALAKGSDEVDEDLNHIVTLVMSRVRFPTPESQTALFEYVQLRRYTWGSYFDEFYKRYGNDLTDADNRLIAGATVQQWPRTGTPAYGAVRWYHRPSQGANPQLVEVWKPLIDYYLHR